MTRLFILAMAALTALAATAQAAETFTFDPKHSVASFRVKHMMVANVDGRFREMEGAIVLDREKPEASTVSLSIKTASIDTAEPSRDTHLKSEDFFFAEKFPEITFKSSKVKATGKDAYDVTGLLTIRGVSKEVTLPVTVGGFLKNANGSERAGFETSTTISRKEFGLLWNKAIEARGVAVSDDVRINVNVEAIKKAPEAAAKN